MSTQFYINSFVLTSSNIDTATTNFKSRNDDGDKIIIYDSNNSKSNNKNDLLKNMEKIQSSLPPSTISNINFTTTAPNITKIKTKKTNNKNDSNNIQIIRKPLVVFLYKHSIIETNNDNDTDINIETKKSKIIKGNSSNNNSKRNNKNHNSDKTQKQEKKDFPNNANKASYPERYYEYDYYYRKAQLYDIISEEKNNDYFDTQTNTTCTAMKEWQRLSYFTCNILHEQNLVLNNYIASGMYRNVWKLKDTSSSSASSYLVLKSLKLNSYWLESTYAKHKRESMAMDQMKSSKYINNIYTYCGTSSIFEYIDSNLNLKEYIQLDYNTTMMKPKDILNIAIDVSRALYDSHVFIKDKNSNQRHATIVHNDLKPEQYIYSKKDHKFILTDFNRCTFLTRNQTSASSLLKHKKQQYHCEIPSFAEHKSKLKSPEDYTSLPVTDKSDVYVLGNILYYILTSHYPYDYTTKNNKQAIEFILHGSKPSVPNYFLNNTMITKENPYINIVINAVYKCLTYDYKERPTSYDIVQYLQKSKNDMK